jgi:hypothetical protein
VTYALRAIDLSFRLGDGGTTFDGGNNTVTVSGLRVSATVSKAGAVSMNNATIRVWGLQPSVANRLSTLGKLITAGRNNTVTMSAGAVDGAKSVIFIGTIQQAYLDFQSAPDVPLVITAFTGLLDALRPLAPTTYQGAVDAADVIAGLAKQMGYGFENGGVSGVILSNPYLPGTGRDQAYGAAKAAGINITIDDQPSGTPTIAIWPQDGARDGEAPLISKDTGMVGSPAWTENGIIIKTQFNPQIVFGARVEVKSSQVPNANATWQIFGITHEIEAQMPNGKWFSLLQATVLGHAAIA